jgi:mannitol-1-phosphate 5-dehydrogenase
VKAVIIGPGKVGCGYLTPLFRNEGWEVVLAARTPETADRIRSAGRFNVRVAGGGVQNVNTVRAVVTGSSEFGAAVADADLLLTSVGVGKVAALAPALAHAFGERAPDRPVDIWVVENQDCAPELEAAVRTHAARAGYSLPSLGFAGGVAGVAVAHGDWETSGEVEFLRDDVLTLDLEAARLRSRTPKLQGVRTVDNYLASLHEKLFVFNAGHAMCAYLGSLRGHATVDEAVSDPVLRPLIAGGLIESRRAVIRMHKGLGDDIVGHVSTALHRFGNSHLADPIPRVARDPLRKLSPGERLLGPAMLIQRLYGSVPAHLAAGIASALRYRRDGDEQSARLGRKLRHQGVARVLQDVCSLDAESDLGRAVVACYYGFSLTSRRAALPRFSPTATVPRMDSPSRRRLEVQAGRRGGG